MNARRAAVVAGLSAALALPSAGAARPIRVAASPNVELFGILALLGEPGGAPQGRGGAALDPRFIPYRDHPAVDMARRLIRRRSRNSLMRLALRLSDLPEAKALDAKVPALHRVLLGRVAPAIRDFYRVARFEEYWRERSPGLRTWTEQAEETLADVPVIATLETFFGTARSSYAMVYAPLMERLRTGDVRPAPGGGEAVVVFGPRDGLEQAGRPRERGLVIDVALLEFGRLGVVELVDRNPGLFRKHASLQRRAAARGGLANPKKPWRSFWIDNLAAAVQARLAADLYGPEEGPGILERHHGDDLLAPDIYAALEAYGRERDRFPTFGSFLKELMSRLGSGPGLRAGERRP